MIRVASYCRVSTDKEDQSNSFEAQQRFFREYIDRNPQWELYDIYADEGITGTSTKKRAQFNRMIRDAYAGCFQLIITKEVSRFSRNILDTISYTRELKAIGVGVCFLTENLNTMNPESEMLLTFMGTIAQEESRRTSVRVKWGQTRQMEQGIVFGPSLLGYHVNAGRITINPEEADLVRLIFQKYGIEKKGTSLIAWELQQAGYRTHKGNRNWSAGQIAKILKNEKYVGDLIQKKTITPDYLSHRRKTNQGEEARIEIRNHHDPIISRELWEIVQKELQKRNRHRECLGHSNRYVFSGKIKCGNCGKSFVSRYKYLKNGEKVRRWSCYTAAAKGATFCNIGKLIRDDDARNMLRTALLSLQLDRASIITDVLSAVTDVLNAEDTDITHCPRTLHRSMESLKRKKRNMLDSFFSGEITKEEMKELKADYDAQIGQLSVHMEENIQSETANADVIRQFLEDLLSGRKESDMLYKNILDCLTVYKDRQMELRLVHLPQIFHFSG